MARVEQRAESSEQLLRRWAAGSVSNRTSLISAEEKHRTSSQMSQSGRPDAHRSHGDTVLSFLTE